MFAAAAVHRPGTKATLGRARLGAAAETRARALPEERDAASWQLSQAYRLKALPPRCRSLMTASDPEPPDGLSVSGH